MQSRDFGHVNEGVFSEQILVLASGTTKHHVILYQLPVEVYLENDVRITLTIKEKFLGHFF